jgi:hypothetical protein
VHRFLSRGTFLALPFPILLMHYARDSSRGESLPLRVSHPCISLDTVGTCGGYRNCFLMWDKKLLFWWTNSHWTIVKKKVCGFLRLEYIFCSKTPYVIRDWQTFLIALTCAPLRGQFVSLLVTICLTRDQEGKRRRKYKKISDYSHYIHYQERQ